MDIDDEPAARPDLFIGLVCAAGTDLGPIKNQLQAQLSVVGYDVQLVKVSGIISELLEIDPPADEYDRIRCLMAAGDKFRMHSDNGQGVAAAIIAKIRELRGDDNHSRPTAYLIDSLKNPSEQALLDQVYGRNYYTVSVYLPKEDRLENLKNKVAKGRHQPPSDDHSALAKILISEDEKGIGKKSQNVQDLFPRADFFVNGASDISVQAQRFIELVFGEPYATPTDDEYFMFVARASALRSCDLSRQVGAVIVDRNNAIIATGCNEVPTPGGGFFVEGSRRKILDNRDYKKGHDPNYIEIQRTLIEFIDLLKQSGEVSLSEEASSLVDELLHGEHREMMSNARVRNLIEFGRVVHAEMHAISQAAYNGRPVANASLYCTTFPCHGCARHIISAGIGEVIFIEPYPKSMTSHLYYDEIEMTHDRIDDAEGTAEKVRFRPFHGIAPILYQRVFSNRPRKDVYGTIATWQPLKAVPVGAVHGVERPKIEVTASNSVAAILKKIKVADAAVQKESEDAPRDANPSDQQG